MRTSTPQSRCIVDMAVGTPVTRDGNTQQGLKYTTQIKYYDTYRNLINSFKLEFNKKEEISIISQYHDDIQVNMKQVKHGNFDTP